VSSPAGEGEGSFKLPSGDEPGLLRGFEGTGDAVPRQVGEALFRALFSGDVGHLWARSLGTVEETPDRGLRLQIRGSDGRSGARPESLPWELLYQPDSRDFLALSRRTPIVHVSAASVPGGPVPFPSVLRILAVVAEPPGFAPLDLEGELREISNAWRDRPEVGITVLRDARIETLRRALLEREVHILHFMGHGGFDPSTGQEVLYFERDGRPDPVSGDTLAAQLRDIKTLRLVYLNACGSAPGEGSRDPAEKIAATLVAAGVPVVVAMRVPISDEAAVAFSRAFYLRLAQGDTVDAAVAEGRLAMHSADPGSAAWGAPTLFTRVADGRLFQEPHPPATKLPPLAARPVFGLLAWARDLVRSFFRKSSPTPAVRQPLPEAEAVQSPFYSCFISYSHADQEFAFRLVTALKDRGVSCWLDYQQLLPGDDLHEALENAIKFWERILICCSETSLQSIWVDREIEKALQKEERLWKESKEKVIIPIDLDGALFHCEDAKASTLRSRVVADFKSWKNKKTFEQEVDRLLEALRRSRRKN